MTERITPVVDAIVTEAGGFPVDNVGYWKMVPKFGDSEGAMILTVWFKSGGFLEVPDMDATQFASLLLGIPY